MKEIEKRLEKLEYYQRLLLDMIEKDSHPFYQCIMRASMSKKEVDQLLTVCHTLHNQYNEQKAEGYVDFLPLFTQFAGMLHPNLDVKITIDAMERQNLFVALMQEFRKIIAQNDL